MEGPLPFIPDAFNHNVVSGSESSRKIHGSDLEANPDPGDEGSSSTSKGKGKVKERRRYNHTPDGSWKDHFRGRTGKIFSILMHDTKRGESQISKVLSVKMTVEIGDKILSGNPERLKEAIKSLGLEKPVRVKPRRELLLGPISRLATASYAGRFKVSDQTAAIHLNESLDEKSVKFILNPATFWYGLDLVRARRFGLEEEPYIPLGNTTHGAHDNSASNPDTGFQNTHAKQTYPELQYYGHKGHGYCSSCCSYGCSYQR